MRTKVAVLETVLEKVLSKTSPYMPPSPGGTSYVPMDTKSASHFPCQCTCLSPMAASLSNTTVLSFRDVEAPRPRVVGGSRVGVPGPASTVAEEGSCGVAPVAAPGCLKMPKLIDFLWGWTLQDMVCPEETFTHRTRYDCLQSARKRDMDAVRTLLCTSMFSIPAMAGFCYYYYYLFDVVGVVNLVQAIRGACSRGIASRYKCLAVERMQGSMVTMISSRRASRKSDC
jgi:hypothetical protein